jgi:drug/metabolite transporter (DMT)-like permease
MALRLLLVVFGVWACATAVIMIKASHVHPVMLAGYRLLVAAAALSPLFLRDLRRHAGSYGLAHLRRAVLPGLFLAGHLSVWIFGARLTQAAHASLIVNMMPIVMPFLLYFVVREKVTRLELAGSAFALAGVALLGSADFRVSGECLFGDAMCFVSMTMLAVYMVLARRNRDFPTLWLYVPPLYLVAGTACIAVGLPLAITTGAPLRLESPLEILLILGLGLIPTVIGHTIINYSMKHFRGQMVSIAALGEFIFAGVMAYFVYGEVPVKAFYAAAVLVVAGAALALRDTPAPMAAEETIGRASAG